MLVTPELAEVAKAASTRATQADSCHRYQVMTSSGPDALGKLATSDIWIPDSGTWLDGLTKDAAARWTTGDSVATSPVGLVTPSGASAPTSWASVILGTDPLKVAVPDRDAASRLAFYAATNPLPELNVDSGGRLILLSRFAAASTERLLAEHAADPTAVPSFPISEQAAYVYDRQPNNRPVGVLFPTAGTVFLDYPYLTRADLDAGRQSAAAALAEELRSATTRAELTAAGFRTSDSDAGPKIAGRSAGAMTAIALPAAAARMQAAAQWHVLATDMRMLPLIDVSGSMAWPAGQTGRTRADLLVGAATRALQRLPAGSEIGAWIFSTAQSGPKQDWKELAPIRPLDATVGGETQREILAKLLATINSRLGGDTGLYDSTLAAFRMMTRTYQPNFVDSVVVMTDGVNDDTTGGLSLSQLLATLKREYDPQRPVRIVTIGMGEADPTALRQISAATGGTSYVAKNPADIDTVLVRALLARPLPVS